MTDEVRFKTMKKRKIILSIIADAMILIGGVMFGRPNTDMTVPLIGIFIFFLGIGLAIAAYSFRHSKKYTELEDKVHDVASMKEIVGEFGVGMTVFGLIFIFGMFIGGIALFFFIGHSWYKVFLFFIAYQFVMSIRDLAKVQLAEEE